MKASSTNPSGTSGKTPSIRRCMSLPGIIFALTLSVILFASNALASQAALTWDPDTSTAVTGYKLYYGTAPSIYSQSVDVGYATSYTVSNLTDGQTYYFVVAAYDAAGDQSGYSNEVSKVMPLPQYALTVNKNGTGTGTVSGTGISCGATCADAYNQGTAVALTAAADQGSNFAGWSGGGCSETGQCTVTMNSATSVTATFNATTVNYTITATANGSGTITALNNSNVSQASSGSTTISTVTVNSGTGQSFSITPSAGYSVSTVMVDGVSVDAVTSYSFSNVTGNHTIAATFAAGTYSISASAGNGGSITPAGTSALGYGGSRTFTIAANPNYKIAAVTVDGVSLGTITSYTFTNVQTSHTIAARFTNKKK